MEKNAMDGESTTKSYEEYAEEEKKVTERAETSKTTVSTKKKTGKAKITSLIAQALAAVWIGLWNSLQFANMLKTGSHIEVTDIIFSGLSIAACFSPVYFSMIMDKIKNIRFGDKNENIEMEQ